MIKNVNNVFPYEVFDFDYGFQILRLFFAAYGHCDVCPDCVLNRYPLGKFVEYIRAHPDKYTSRQKKSLDLINFIWNKYDVSFFEFCELFKKYKKTYHTSDVPSKLIFENKPLGQWVANTRARKHELSVEKYQYLCHIGFIWSRNDFVFEERLAMCRNLIDQGIHITKKYTSDNIKIGEWYYNLTHGRIKIDASRQVLLEQYSFTSKGVCFA